MADILSFTEKQKQKQASAQAQLPARPKLKTMQACTLAGLLEFLSQFGAPYILVTNDKAGNSNIPDACFKDGRVVLDLTPTAIVKFSLDESYLTFGCRFSGVHHDLCIPYEAIVQVGVMNSEFHFLFPVIEAV